MSLILCCPVSRALIQVSPEKWNKQKHNRANIHDKKYQKEKREVVTMHRSFSLQTVFEENTSKYLQSINYQVHPQDRVDKRGYTSCRVQCITRDSVGVDNLALIDPTCIFLLHKEKIENNDRQIFHVVEGKLRKSLYCFLFEFGISFFLGLWELKQHYLTQRLR